MQERTLTSKNQVTIEINDIVKMVNDKGNPILNHCTLHLEGPALVAIVGASGAGESSLLYSMGGLDKPSQCSVVLNGVDLYRLNNEKWTIFLRRNVASKPLSQGYS